MAAVCRGKLGRHPPTELRTQVSLELHVSPESPCVRQMRCCGKKHKDCLWKLMEEQANTPSNPSVRPAGTMIHLLGPPCWDTRASIGKSVMGPLPLGMVLIVPASGMKPPSGDPYANEASCLSQRGVHWQLRAWGF